METAPHAADRSSAWLTFWLHPRTALADVVRSGPRQHLWLLATLGAIGATVVQLAFNGLTPLIADWRFLALLIAASALLSLPGLYLSGYAYGAAGKLLGGEGGPADVRAALAWGQLPLAATAVMLMPLAGWFAMPGSAAAYIAGVGLVWSLGVTWAMLGRVQHFRAWRTIASGLMGGVFSLVLFALLVLPVRIFFFQPFNIPSGSMTPTLQVGDYLFAAKYPYGYSRFSFPFSPNLFAGRMLAAEPRRGDVVIFKYPRDNSTDWISRIVGLPGDRVQMIKGQLHINGTPVARERLADFEFVMDGRPVRAKRWRETLPGGAAHETIDIVENGFLDDTVELRVPPGRYFVMSDNRDNAVDSRIQGDVGFVPFENLVGRAAVIFYSAANAAGRRGGLDRAGFVR